MSYKKQPSGRTITIHVRATSRHKAFSYKSKDTGNPGKGPKVIPIKRHGALTKYGYAISKSELARHLALGKAIKEFGPMKVGQMLQAQATLRKNIAPTSSAKFAADAEWAKGQAA